uniref:receptor protein-tyrosine kinase n=1 Tax=Tetraodon nigroviridis TaxID=99883 RepID=H3DGS2_TETNG
MSEGHEAHFNCSIDIPNERLEPTIIWVKDGQDLAGNTLMAIKDLQMSTNGVTTHLSEISISRVQLTDAGEYRCRLAIGPRLVESQPIILEVEGLPSFIFHPEDQNVTRGAPFTLTCEAVGSPGPIKIRWLRDGLPSNVSYDSPSSLLVSGVDKYTQFSCEAHNKKGVSTSREANINIKVPPSPVTGVRVTKRESSKLVLSWSPGHDGFSPITKCHIRVSRREGEATETRLVNVMAPPFQSEVAGLQAVTCYNISVSCSNEVGASPFTAWIQSNTTEGVPSVFPRNVTVRLNGSRLLVTWKPPPDDKINGILRGYEVIVRHGPNMDKVSTSGTNLSLTGYKGDIFYLFKICYISSACCFPNLFLVPSESAAPPTSSPDDGVPDSLYVVLGVVCGFCLLMIILFGAVCIHKRTSNLFFWRIFGGAEKPQPVVEYTPQRSYNRSAARVTRTSFSLDVANLGISEELKAKLQDVMVARSLLSIGKVLGEEGEFGSVVEGHLRQTDGTFEKVAVKTMKLDSFSQREIEEFLNEAACMKDFSHPNVIGLLGVCLEIESERYPKPMVILPFMKYGDLHSFLEVTLGESPVFLPTQTLLKFMIDIALGMEYLSGRHFLHRDLAARNCMLRDDMTVCVADFGLSKKIYSGDYYRQGRIAKMPVKWIAVESLADRVFTVKSDVWAFGVTMWEIATLGMTPYPGIQNHEIYDYLLAGHRLKQPAGCLDEIYEIMSSCWRPDPSERPLFPQLREMLEKVAEKLPESCSKNDIIYINTSFPEEDPA